MSTRTLLDCVKAERYNQSVYLIRGDKQNFIIQRGHVSDADSIVHELDLMATRVTKTHIKYAQIYPADFSGLICDFPNLERYHALKTVESQKAPENDGQTALPFDNAKTLEKRLDRLESILARLDRHLQIPEEK